MNLSIIEKVRIFIYLIFNNVKNVYILTPKNFYYYLPFFFRKIKFYGITIKSTRSRPGSFLSKYLYKSVELDRLNIKKRKSSYVIQENLIEGKTNRIYLNKNSQITHNFIYPKKFVFFHYKDVFFRKLLNWDLITIVKLLDFLGNKYENICFSSELNNNEINNFFLDRYNTFDYNKKKKNIINNKNIIFLKNIDGYDLFDAVKNSSKVVSPEGIITHMGYFLKKPILALMHFNLKNRNDLISQIISCKEWFPPSNYNFTVLKKDYLKSINKINKHL